MNLLVNVILILILVLLETNAAPLVSSSASSLLSQPLAPIPSLSGDSSPMPPLSLPSLTALADLPVIVVLRPRAPEQLQPQQHSFDATVALSAHLDQLRSLIDSVTGHSSTMTPQQQGQPPSPGSLGQVMQIGDFLGYSGVFPLSVLNWIQQQQVGLIVLVLCFLFHLIIFVFTLRRHRTCGLSSQTFS
jgi:hypothetical protein